MLGGSGAWMSRTYVEGGRCAVMYASRSTRSVMMPVTWSPSVTSAVPEAVAVMRALTSATGVSPLQNRGGRQPQRV